MTEHDLIDVSVCPILGAFVRAWNDGLPVADRNRLLKPLLPRLIGTRGSDALAERRSLMATDWHLRVHTPAWLRSGKLASAAAALEALPEITASSQIQAYHTPIKAARREAAVVLAAGWYAADEAARTAAGEAARLGAWDATRAA